MEIKVADLDQEGQEFKVAQGGLGGRGNFVDKQLRISQPGKEGETKQY